MKDIETILQEWSAAMLGRDLEAVMRYCHPDIRLAMHFGDLPLPFVGVTVGIDAARRRTQQIFATWQFPAGELFVLSKDGNSVRARLTLTVQHRWTGFSINTKIRQNFEFEDDLIRSFDGYMDAPRFNAFMKFVGIAPAKSRATTD